MTYFYLTATTAIGGAFFAIIGIEAVSDWLIAYMGRVWVFLTSLESLIVTIFWLMAADWVTGMIAARVAGAKVASRKMTRTAIKFFIASIVIYTPHLVAVKLGINYDLAFFPAGVIIATELTSLMENASKILGYDVGAWITSELKARLGKKK